MSDNESTSSTRERIDDRTSTSKDTGFSPEDALTLFASKLDSALEKHKKDIFDEIELKIGCGSSNKRSKSSASVPKFKFEGNGKQHEFNSERLEDIIKAKTYLERGSISSAMKSLDDAENAIKERNKIIRIADKYGWDVVEEYVDDPLTENSEDANRLKQAEFRAKLKRRDKAQARQQKTPYYKSTEVQKNTSDLFRRPGGAFAEQVPQTRNTTEGKHVYSQSEYYGAKKGETRCYYCNGEGHWAYQCPRKASKYPPGKQ